MPRSVRPWLLRPVATPIPDLGRFQVLAADLQDRTHLAPRTTPPLGLSKSKSKIKINKKESKQKRFYGKSFARVMEGDDERVNYDGLDCDSDSRSTHDCQSTRKRRGGFFRTTEICMLRSRHRRAKIVNRAEKKEKDEQSTERCE